MEEKKVPAKKRYPFPVRRSVDPRAETDTGEDTGGSETHYRKFLERKTVYPVHFAEAKDGGIAALLIHEDWYDLLKPLYDYFEVVSGAVSVADTPAHVQSLLEGLVQFVPEYGMQGWVFTVSVFSALKMAASRALEVGTFHYERTAVYSPRTAGEVGYGRLTLVSEVDP